jgi:hypothetical protein
VSFQPADAPGDRESSWSCRPLESREPS